MPNNKIVKLVLLTILITATINLSHEIYKWERSMVDAETLFQEYGISVCVSPQIEQSSRFWIELALILSLIGGWLKRSVGQLLSLLGLLATIAIYAVWWEYLFALVNEAGGTVMPDHTAYLYGGNIYDVTIAVAVAILLMWQLKIVISCWRKQES